jgi:Na+/H+ antiporter NhaD/arsenite permease-like protein
MLLIRPLLQTNSERKHVTHIPVFFIFLVSNIGGCLTPLADPPLFLGFLRGVPFAWTLRLLPEWAFMVGLLLVIFFFLDRRMVRRESASAIRLDRERRIPLRMQGAHNFVFLAGVLLSLFLPGSLAWLRALLMLGLAGVAFLSTPRALHMQNRFTFFPINEVAILFAGIFVTMVPALLLLEERGAALGISEPWQFFWLGGALSGVLDNAPTYLTFAALAHGTILPGMAGDSLLPLVRHPAGGELLRAISLGTVFMGANTYIGNGPNFMVRAIAESRKVPMPGFFGYMLWSGGILVPLFALVTWIFLL